MRETAAVRKTGLMLLVLLILALGTILAAPSFMDWNAWRDDVAARLESITGRAVEIDGDLSVRILPRPALSVKDVRLANIRGGSTRQMVRIGALSGSIAWGPLFRGELKVISVQITDPVILLERLPDGRANWMFPDAQPEGGGSGRSVTMPIPAPPNAPSHGHATDTAPKTTTPPWTSGSGFTVALENVRLRGGHLVLRDARRGREARLAITSLDLSADSLLGPYHLSGDVTAGDKAGIPVVFDALVGSLQTTSGTSLNLQVLLPDSGTTATLSGGVDDLFGRPTLRGDLRMTSPDAVAALTDIGRRIGPLPGMAVLAGRPVSMTTRITATPTTVDLSSLRLQVNDADARGKVNLTLDGARPNVAVSLTLRALDLDTWFPAAPPSDTPQPDTSPETVDSLASITLPTMPITARLSVAAEGVTWRGEVIRQARLDATFDEGVLTLEDVRATLPGAGAITIQGTMDARQEQPRLTGHLKAHAGNLREVLTWVGVPQNSLPPDRLRGFALNVDLDGTPARATLTNLDLTVDTTHATGAIVLRPGTRLGIGANIRVGMLNLDAYRGTETESPHPSGTTADAGASPGWAWLAPLSRMDANVRLRIDTLTVDDLPLQDVVLSGSLLGGRLTLQDAHIGTVADARIAVSGGVSGFGRQPLFHGLTVALDIPDPSRTARLLRVELPIPLRTLGPVTQTLRLDGPADALEIIGAVHLQDGSLDIAGNVWNAMAPNPSYDLSIDLRHPDVVALAGLLGGGSMLPVSADHATPRRVTLVGRLGGEGAALTLAPVTLTVGEVHLEGAATLGLDGPRPHLVVDLDGDRLTVPMPPWLPLPGFLDADLTLTTRTLAPTGWPPLDDTTLTARWTGAALILESLTATVAGGPLEATGSMDVPPVGRTPSWTIQGHATDIDLARLLRDMPSHAPDGIAGSAEVSLSLTGTGTTAPLILATATGTGAVSIHGLRMPSNAATGSTLAALLRSAGDLDRATADLMGPDTEPRQRNTDLTAEGTIGNGVLTLERVHLGHPWYQGDLTGSLDLANSVVDVEGTLSVTEGPLRAAVGDTIPVRISGPLAAPDVTAAFRRLRLNPGRLGTGTR